VARRRAGVGGRHRVHGVGKSFHVPATPSLPPAHLVSFGTHLTGHTGHLRGKRRKLIHHRIDGVLKLQDSPFTSTVIFFDKSPVATAVVTRQCCAPAK